LDVVYNASNNELVRTKTLVKNCIIQVDATPFKAYYLKKYAVDLGNKKKGAETEAVKRSKHATRYLAKRVAGNFIDEAVKEQFPLQRLLACVSSRPGQSGRVDGYILEGSELQFYIKKIEQKKK
jgi:small subunit ribosomal protein S8e